MSTSSEYTRLLRTVAVTGPGVAFNMYGVFGTFTFMKRITGVFSALVVNYEGSLDGVNWFTLGTDSTTADGVTFVVDKPCKHVRANVGTFTGGTDVSVEMVQLPLS